MRRTDALSLRRREAIGSVLPDGERQKGEELCGNATKERGRGRRQPRSHGKKKKGGGEVPT